LPARRSRYLIPPIPETEPWAAGLATAINRVRAGPPMDSGLDLQRRKASTRHEREKTIGFRAHKLTCVEEKDHRVVRDGEVLVVGRVPPDCWGQVEMPLGLLPGQVLRHDRVDRVDWVGAGRKQVRERHRPVLVVVEGEGFVPAARGAFVEPEFLKDQALGSVPRLRVLGNSARRLPGAEGLRVDDHLVRQVPRARRLRRVDHVVALQSEVVDDRLGVGIVDPEAHVDGVSGRVSLHEAEVARLDVTAELPACGLRASNGHNGTG